MQMLVFCKRVLILQNKNSNFLIPKVIPGGMKCLWDVSNRSPLREDVFFVMSLWRLKYISKKMSFLWPLYHVSNTSHKRCFSGDVFKASQTYLKNDVYSLTSLICPKNKSWKYLWLFKNITQKWFRADKIDVWALKTLKKWNVVF